MATYSELYQDLKINYARFLDIKNELAVELQEKGLEHAINKEWGKIFKAYDALKANMRQFIQDPDSAIVEEIKTKAHNLWFYVQEIEDRILNIDVSTKVANYFIDAVDTLEDIIADILEED